MDIKDLLQEVAEENGVADATVAKLVDASTLTEIRKGMGVTPENYDDSSVRIVSLLVDDSGSIAGPNTQHVIDGCNMIVGSLRGVKPAENRKVLIGCRYLNALNYETRFVMPVKAGTQFKLTDKYLILSISIGSQIG